MIFPLIAGNSQNVNDTEHLENIDSCHLRKENRLFTLKKNPTFRTKLKITHLNFEVKHDAKTKSLKTSFDAFIPPSASLPSVYLIYPPFGLTSSGLFDIIPPFGLT